MKTKSQYGAVNLRDRNGKLYLEFRANGERFQKSLGLTSTPANKSVAKQIASRIELDIALGTFTGNISDYVNQPDKKQATTKPANLSPYDVWELYRLEHDLKGNDFESVTRFLKRTSPNWVSIEKSVANQEWSATTHNRYAKLLNKAFTWGKLNHGTTEVFIPMVKGSKVTHSNRKPFTDDEIKAIINAFDNDSFCSAKSAYKHSHYSDFVRFILATGVRMGEAVGLQAWHIDTVNHTVEISESLSPKSAYDNRRVQKSTKTGSVRVLPLPDSLIKRIIKRMESLEKTAYVFTGPSGQPIDADNFRGRVWKPVLNGLGIEYRVPYTARHTMASRAIEQGIPITGVAYLMGHADTTMVMKQYGHMINRPNLPTINLEA